MTSLTRPSHGYFVFSLDTELAWGHWDCFDPEMFSRDGSRERAGIRGILDLLDRYRIPATWAIVGHLLYERCEECEECPVRSWQGVHPTYEAIYETGDPLWYGPDILEEVLGRPTEHEIGFHGYTHRTFDRLAPDQALFEIREWQRLTARWSLNGNSVVFPRNRQGHHELFSQHGFRCFRGEERVPALFQRPQLGRPLRRFYEELANFMVPSTYSLPRPNGPRSHGALVDLPASRWLSGPRTGLAGTLGRLGAERIRSQRIAQGVRRAARRAEVLHLYAHPYEFRGERDLSNLERVLAVVAEERDQGRIEPMTMANLSSTVLADDRAFSERTTE